MGQNITVEKLLMGQNTTVGNLLMGQNTMVGKLLMGQNTTVGKLLMGQNTTVGKLLMDKTHGGKICLGKTLRWHIMDKTKHHGGRLLNGAQKTAEEYVVKPTQHLGEKVGNLYGSRDERGNPEYESGRIYFKKAEEFGLAMIAILDSYSPKGSHLQGSQLTQLAEITKHYKDSKIWNSKIVKALKGTGMAYARVKVYQDQESGNCYVAYRGSKILHDWVVNARLKSFNKESVKLAGIKYFTSIAKISTKYIRNIYEIICERRMKTGSGT